MTGQAVELHRLDAAGVDRVIVDLRDERHDHDAESVDHRVAVYESGRARVGMVDMAPARSTREAVGSSDV